MKGQSTFSKYALDLIKSLLADKVGDFRSKELLCKKKNLKRIDK